MKIKDEAMNLQATILDGVDDVIVLFEGVNAVFDAELDQLGDSIVLGLELIEFLPMILMQLPK